MALQQFQLAYLEHLMMIFVHSGLRKACSHELLSVRRYKTRYRAGCNAVILLTADNSFLFFFKAKEVEL